MNTFIAVMEIVVAAASVGTVIAIVVIARVLLHTHRGRK